MENTSKVKKFLSENFNLSENEIALYIELLKSDSSTVLELSTKTKINRSTVHMNIEYLTKKELVTQIAKGRGSRRLIIPEPIEKLSSLLKQKEITLEIAQQQIPDIFEKINSIIDKKTERDEINIRYYKGKKEVDFIYDEILKAKEIRSYLNCKKLAKTFPNNVMRFLKNFNERKDMHMYEIMEDSKQSKEYSNLMSNEKRYHCTITPKSMNISTMDYMIFDNKVAVIDLEEDDTTGTLISSKNYYQNAKAVFDFVWNFLKSYEK